MKWQIVPHTRESFAITLALLVMAPIIQVGLYAFLVACGLPKDSRSLQLLTIFPAGLGWVLPFYYAFYFRLLGNPRPSDDSGTI